jgi:hypothetical protein
MGDPSLRRVRAMLGFVAGGLFISGVTIWPWELELTLAISILDGLAVFEPLRALLQELLSDMLALREKDSFVLYIADWLAFAHLILTALFLMAIRDPVRNILVVRFGILCSLSVPLLAVTCVPLRGIPLFWILVDSSFALCAIPLLLALRDLRLLESQGGEAP